MKTTQDLALDKALEELGEHFDNVVIICDAPDIEFPNEDDPSLFTRRKGSTWTCVGMMKAYSAIFLEAFLKTKDREVE